MATSLPCTAHRTSCTLTGSTSSRTATGYRPSSPASWSCTVTCATVPPLQTRPSPAARPTTSQSWWSSTRCRSWTRLRCSGRWWRPARSPCTASESGSPKRIWWPKVCRTASSRSAPSWACCASRWESIWARTPSSIPIPPTRGTPWVPPTHGTTACVPSRTE